MSILAGFEPSPVKKRRKSKAPPSVMEGDLGDGRQLFPRISTRLILPLIVLGSSVTNSTIRGYL